jgi:hypothetical protein
MTQHEIPIPETVNEDDDDEESVNKSEATDEWEAQWQDFGQLPSALIPEFNVALAKFIVNQTGTDKTFPEVLQREGGIHSYERFFDVFNRPNPKILEILGGKVGTEYEQDIVKCIALANFL